MVLALIITSANCLFVSGPMSSPLWSDTGGNQYTYKCYNVVIQTRLPSAIPSETVQIDTLAVGEKLSPTFNSVNQYVVYCYCCNH